MTLSSWFDVSVIVGHLRGFCLKMAGLSHCRHRTGLLSLNTEELALCFRADVCSWTSGQYGSKRGRQTLTTKKMLGQPMRSYGIAHYLTSMRRFLTDLTKRPYAVNGEPARRISLDFVPKEVLTTPAPIRKALDAASPRDIDAQVWSKLAIAPATLSPQDLRRTTRYPLSFYTALA